MRSLVTLAGSLSTLKKLEWRICNAHLTFNKSSPFLEPSGEVREKIHMYTMIQIVRHKSLSIIAAMYILQASELTIWWRKKLATYLVNQRTVYSDTGRCTHIPWTFHVIICPGVLSIDAR